MNSRLLEALEWISCQSPVLVTLLSTMVERSQARWY